jgi:hypothetical protein
MHATANSKTTIQMRNLMCAVAFDPKGELWVSSGATDSC